MVEYSLDCHLPPPCGAIVSESRSRVHVAGHEGDATSPSPIVTPRGQNRGATRLSLVVGHKLHFRPSVLRGGGRQPGYY